MSLISPQTIAEQFWQHDCPAKEGAIVYTQKEIACYLCSQTEQQTKQPPQAEE